MNYLDVTFNLTDGSYYPYRKPNNLPQYINIKSNHPPNIIKQLPASINRRISDNSCNEHEFNKAKPIYDDALKSSGYTEMLSFNKHRHPVRPRRNRQRNIIWYNPTFSKSVKTNIGRTFLQLISRHFPRHHRYHSLFNKNNVKVSYSCMDNMQSIINEMLLWSIHWVACGTCYRKSEGTELCGIEIQHSSLWRTTNKGEARNIGFWADMLIISLTTSVYHKCALWASDGFLILEFTEVKPCRAGLVFGWETKTTFPSKNRSIGPKILLTLTNANSARYRSC